MSIGFQIIMFICFVPILAIMYFVMRSETKVRKNIVTGVTIPYNGREDEGVLQALEKFKQHLNLVGLALLLLVLPVFFLQYASIVLAYYMTWMLLAIGVPYIPYVICHNKISGIKHDRGWTSPIAGKSIVDIGAAAKDNKLPSRIWLIIPLIISMFPMMLAFRETSDDRIIQLIIYGSNSGAIILSILFYKIIDKQRAEIIDDNTSITLALTRIRKYHWSKFWLWMAWATCGYTLACWLFGCKAMAVLILSITYSCVLIIVALNAELTTRKVQQNLSATSGKAKYVDDDQYWIKGTFYYNPNNKKILVNARVGMNTNVNLATTTGKILMTLALASLLAMPFFGIYLINEEFTHINISVVDNKLEGKHTKEVFVIETSEIESVEMIEVLPPRSKIVGTGLDRLLKGSFSISGIGKSNLLLNPKEPPFIIIKTGDEIYIVNDGDREDTLEVYKELEEKVK